MGKAFPLSSTSFKIWLWIPLILFSVSAMILSALIFYSLLPWIDKTWRRVSRINSASGMHALNLASSTPNHLTTSFINPYGTPSPLRDIWWCFFSWSNIKLCTIFNSFITFVGWTKIFYTMTASFKYYASLGLPF